MIILGHCDEPMKNTLETTIGYMEANRRRDVISLLRMIKAAAHGAVDKMYPPKQVVLALKHMCNAAQMEKEPLSTYYNRFQSLVERAENVYGELKPVVLAEKDPTYGSSVDQRKIVSSERGKVLAYVFMARAKKELKPLLHALDNDYALGDNKFPDSVEEALQVLSAYKDCNVKKAFGASKGKEDERPELTLMQKQEMYNKGLCFKCGKPGHKSFQCKEKKPPVGEKEKTEEQQHMQGEGIIKTWESQLVP